MSNQPVKRLSFNKIIIDIPDILKKEDGEISHFAIPLLEFLKHTNNWIPFTTQVLVPGKNYDDLVIWFHEKLGTEQDFSFVSFLLQDKPTITKIKTLSKNAIFITNNPHYQQLTNVIYLDNILKNKEQKFQYLIRYLKQVFYMCPRNLIRQAKNGNAEAMDWTIHRIKLYLSGLITSLYIKFNSPSSTHYSIYRKETIDQIINEKILETIDKWNEKKLVIEKLAFIMVREAFKPSSFYQSDSLKTELIDCPPDKRIEKRIANQFLYKESETTFPQSIKEIHKILNNSLSFLEKRVLDLRLGLNDSISLNFPEIVKYFAKDGLHYSKQAIYKSYKRALKKLKSSQELRKIWEERTKSS